MFGFFLTPQLAWPSPSELLPQPTVDAGAGVGEVAGSAREMLLPARLPCEPGASEVPAPAHPATAATAAATANAFRPGRTLQLSDWARRAQGGGGRCTAR